MTAERTAERLPIHCLSTVCRSPHTPLCVAQHRCCARLMARFTWLATQNDRAEGRLMRNRAAWCYPSILAVAESGRLVAPDAKELF